MPQAPHPSDTPPPIDAPPIPVLTDLDAMPPSRSAYRVISTSDQRLWLFADSDQSSRNAHAYDMPLTGAAYDAFVQQHKNNAMVASYWDGAPPLDYRLTLRSFWRPLTQFYTRVYPGNSTSITTTRTWGVSTTVAQSYTVTVGASTGEVGLSSSISATFSYSVTTTEETSETVSHTIEAPHEGKVRVWLPWQLVDEICALRPDGSMIPVGNNPATNRRADILWMAGAPLDIRSGAYTYYEAGRWEFPRRIVAPWSRDFDEPS